MRSEITINVEFLAGTNIRDAINEAKLKSELWDVAFVHFNFNGVEMSISRNCDVDKSVTCFHDQLKSGGTLKMVCN